VIGGRLAQKINQHVGRFYFPLAGIMGAFALSCFITSTYLPLIAVGLAGYGFSFMMLQPMLIARAQQAFPGGRGTVMSLASLNMALGGGVGTYLNGFLLQAQGFKFIFMTSAGFFLLAAVLAWVTAMHLQRNPGR